MRHRRAFCDERVETLESLRLDNYRPLQNEVLTIRDIVSTVSFGQPIGLIINLFMLFFCNGIIPTTSRVSHPVKFTTYLIYYWTSHSVALPTNPGLPSIADTNITYECGKVTIVNEGATTSGCYKQNIDSSETEVCVCRSVIGQMPCNGGGGVRPRLLFSCTVAVVATVLLILSRFELH